ncbi:histidine--tRNA ligase [Pelodictyon phaeoclathratiforme]|jgi:histidyl-tRNA synthetase|uniref:Histidine--tRNA ligase n=1 Tax=Pelodictyon phaeoclathratiforme (strain DSM 5477 / BU-1) TaxID=324925 RepID=SYH_PELPB|nr:histidine--tRNA ligase [Pelodictyon phaeoclathratiforme]B4SCE2.1 RecName: Full=Histidine--tRNA ligase; AltName: Full=Histidyl-tRNA synthetase; Short=HisRS [Pelodictyon phaeoclathratiforme BU-1]ACF42722.1 histidyl-tRNA synthetase [Pelodictyon phaeoclathratiforme BU-1]MBV5288495.1 histidine--tRNA ligase [Pelodictyon phaeoclathratiforme]
MPQYQAVKGTRDIFPEEAARWKYVEGVVHAIASLYGFSEIRTPVFEYTELFQRGIGSTTDIVGKEMFSFLPDPKGRSLTLRPEMTAGVMRAALQNNLLSSAPVQKLYYIGELFRKERPQAGRQRQFSQFGAELLGVSSPAAVAEVITLMMQLFASLGLRSLKLRINSLGDTEDRLRYREALQLYFTPFHELLDDASKERLEKNPLRILDTKNPALQELVAGAPRLYDYLKDASLQDFEKVLFYLEERDIAYEIDYRLVRGLDYYCNTAFEVTSSELGAQDAIGGGGRYDGLARELGSSVDVPASGFAVGMERLLITMEKQGLFATLAPQGPLVYVIVQQQDLADNALQIVWRLRKAGIKTEVDLAARSMKAQMREANKIKAAYALFIGTTEETTGLYALKNLETSEQITLTLEAVLELLREQAVGEQLD